MADFAFSDPIFNDTFLAFLRDSRMHGEITIAMVNGEVLQARITQSVLAKDTQGKKIIYDVALFSPQKRKSP